jgi:hypothetical protein
MSNLKFFVMIKHLSSLGTVLNKSEQEHIVGGGKKRLVTVTCTFDDGTWWSGQSEYPGPGAFYMYDHCLNSGGTPDDDILAP